MICQDISATLSLCNSRIIRECGCLQVMDGCIRGLLLWEVADHTRVVLLDTHGCLSLTFKNKTSDSLRLVKPFTLIFLTVSTSSTFETALFYPYKYRPWGGCWISLGEQSHGGGFYTEVFGAVELRILWLQRSPCLRRWVVI